MIRLFVLVRKAIRSNELAVDEQSRRRKRTFVNENPFENPVTMKQRRGLYGIYAVIKNSPVQPIAGIGLME